MTIEAVGVIGAGSIGSSVAQALLATGHRVVLVDLDDARLADARRRIRDGLRADMLLKRLTVAVAPDALLGRATFTRDLKTVAELEYVIENVPERWEVKRAVYESLDDVCSSECVFAANTSAIPITRIATATRHPGRVIGVHFMNPAFKITTVELIRGRETDQKTVDRTHTLLGQLGKHTVLVADTPGFVSNRVLMSAINEAVFLVREGVATACDVDRIFRECLGHAMGPLETADLIGLDNVVDTLDVLHDAFGGSRFQACPLLREMVGEGLLGRKTGSGFYCYT